MIARAIEWARRKNQIHPNFFLMTDAQAYGYLETKCNQVTQSLMEMARRWEWYTCVFQHQTTTPNDQERTFFELPDGRQTVPDRIASELGAEPWELTLHFGQNRAYKAIRVPVITADGQVKPPPVTALEPVWDVQLYVHPRLMDKSALIEWIGDYMRFQLGL
jgi:hypothetical protein